jgi:hypothetical protein
MNPTKEMGIGYAMKSRSDLRRRDLVVAATVGLPQSVPRRSGWDALDECVELFASMEPSAVPPKGQSSLTGK